MDLLVNELYRYQNARYNDKKKQVYLICLFLKFMFNPLNAELNPICHLLALLGAHHIFHVSGLRVNVLMPK